MQIAGEEGADELMTVVKFIVDAGTSGESGQFRVLVSVARSDC